jgi:hypothetical protein
MTGTDLATCRRFSAALAGLDVDAALVDAHPDIELHVARATLYGAAGLRTLLAPPALEYLERTIIVDDILDAGECVVALGRIQLRWRDTDDPADTQPVGAVLDLRDGRVIRWQAFPDPDAALAAAAARTHTRIPGLDGRTQAAVPDRRPPRIHSPAHTDPHAQDDRRRDGDSGTRVPGGRKPSSSTLRRP